MRWSYVLISQSTGFHSFVDTPNEATMPPGATDDETKATKDLKWYDSSNSLLREDG